MPEILLVTPGLEAGDAVGHDVCRMQDVLAKEGHTVQIMAGQNGTDRPVLSLNKKALARADLILYHYSIFWPEFHSMIDQLHVPLAIRYHNITPARFYEAYHQGIAYNCHLARQKIASLSGKAKIAICNSEFSATELRSVLPDAIVRVLPPMHMADELVSLEPDLKKVDRLKNIYPERIYNFLCVGRIVPNKNHLLLLEAFARFNAIHPSSRLVLAGRLDPSLHSYIKEIKRRISKLGLGKSVAFTGSVSAAVLKSHYLISDCLIALSEHEGFCVPPVEAMALMVPVLALARTALPETIGDCGLLLEKDDPSFIAAAMEAILEPEMQKKYALAGFARYNQNFSGAMQEKIFVRIIREAFALLS